MMNRLAITVIKIKI